MSTAVPTGEARPQAGPTPIERSSRSTAPGSGSPVPPLPAGFTQLLPIEGTWLHGTNKIVYLLGPEGDWMEEVATVEGEIVRDTFLADGSVERPPSMAKLRIAGVEDVPGIDGGRRFTFRIEPGERHRPWLEQLDIEFRGPDTLQRTEKRFHWIRTETFTRERTR